MTEQVASQDIDSRTGKVVNQGKPVTHDMEDGVSIGHSAEPEGDPESKPAGELPPMAPQRVTRDEIYAKAKRHQESEISEALESMSEEDRKHYDRMVAEAGGGPDPFAQETDTPEQAAVAQQQAAQDQPARSKESPQSTDPALDPNEETVSIIVYGMREEVPRSQVEAAGGIEAYQKSRAADEKLRRLTTYEASLRDYDRQVTERAERLRRSPPAQQDSTGETDLPPTGDPNSADEKELAAEIVAGFYSGDEEKAIEKLSSAFQRLKSGATGATRPTSHEAPAAQQQYYPQQPVQQQGPTAKDMDDANAVFANEFGDLQTPVLRSAVLAMVGEVQREPLMRGRPLAEVTREAAMRVRADVRGVRPENPQPYRESNVPTDLGERMQLKSRTVVAPLHQPTQRAPSGAEVEPQYPSNSEYVQQMRERRNLPRTS